MQPLTEIAAAQYFTRRQFFSRCALGLGSIALASMMNDRRAFGAAVPPLPNPMAPKPPHFAPRAKNVIFIDATGHMALGTYLSPTTASSPDWPGDIATLNGNTVTWSDGTVWTATPNPATQVTVTEYTNPKGLPVRVIQNGTNMLAFVDGAGNTSLGTFLNSTQAVSQLYVGDVATFNADTVVWNLDKLVNRNAQQFDAAQAAQGGLYTGGIASWRKLDDNTVEITTKVVDAVLPNPDRRA
jgi:hypothetical protein